MEENNASTLGAATTASVATAMRAIPFENGHRLLLLLLRDAADTTIVLGCLPDSTEERDREWEWIEK